MKHIAYALVPSPWLADRLGLPRRSPWAAFAAFPLAVLVVFLVWSGWLYPLRPDTIGALGHPFTADPLLSGAWGGPTLVGAWAVHAMAALGIQVVCLAMIRRLPGRIPAEAV
jgi:hypothetical protein